MTHHTHQKLIALRTKGRALAIVTSCTERHLYGSLRGKEMSWHRNSGHAMAITPDTLDEGADLRYPYGAETPRWPTYTDEQIEYWAGVYAERQLADRDIVFEVFLRAPREILAAVAKSAAEATVEERARQREALPAETRQRGARLFEPMHHRRPVGRRRLGVH